MKTYLKMTLVGWGWLCIAVFLVVIWALAIQHVITPIVLAVVR